MCYIDPDIERILFKKIENGEIKGFYVCKDCKKVCVRTGTRQTRCEGCQQYIRYEKQKAHKRERYHQQKLIREKRAKELSEMVTAKYNMASGSRNV